MDWLDKTIDDYEEKDKHRKAIEAEDKKRMASWGCPLDYWFTSSLRFKHCFSAIFFSLETT